MGRQLEKVGGWKTVSVGNGNTQIWVAPLESDGPIQAVSCSLDGNWIATATKELVRIWDAQSGVLLRERRFSGLLSIGEIPSTVVLVSGAIIIIAVF
jgi:hypothetical protein